MLKLLAIANEEGVTRIDRGAYDEALTKLLAGRTDRVARRKRVVEAIEAEVDNERDVTDVVALPQWEIPRSVVREKRLAWEVRLEVSHGVLREVLV